MVQKHFIVIDEQDQIETITRIAGTLRRDGIELVHQYTNPTDHQERDSEGNPTMNRDGLKKAINDIPFFRRAEVIACDFNLVLDLDGFEVITMIRDLGYSIKRQIILYSADIDGVVTRIIEKIQQLHDNIQEQKKLLVALSHANIEFIGRDGYEQEVITKIKREPDFSLSTELTNWLHKFSNEKFISFFPPYDEKTLGEIADEIEQSTHNSKQFQKEIIEHLLSKLMNLDELE